MRAMMVLSLAVNLLVLVPVCLGLVTKASWTVVAYGVETPARGILLAVYFAILLLSAGLLVRPVPVMVAALLLVQIVYKVTTPFAVGTIANPVVISNLAIAALHCATIWAIWRAHGV